MSEKKKAGRPKHKPTDQIRKQVETMSGMGLTQEAMASVLGLSVDTLFLYYKDVLESGKAKANFEVIKSLYKNATTMNNVTAQIFWAKTQLKWRDTTAVEISGPNGGPVEISEAKSKLLAGINLPKKDEDNE